MKFIYGLDNLSKLRKETVVSIGIFDGVHRGHQFLLQRAVGNAARLHALSVCLTFWPHPKKSHFIYSLDHRLDLIAQLNFDICVVIRFDKTFARMEPERFVKKILVGKLNIISLVVGSNFSFGKNASANINTMRRLSSQYKFYIDEVKPLKINNRIISSTMIRNYIEQGRLKQASNLLGRNVTVYGEVIRGWRLGRMLGFPTANINPHHEVLPAIGVYAVKVRYENKLYPGACYIGYRPTLKFKNSLSIEVNIVDFSKIIYGKKLHIEFIKKIRPERRFSSKEGLCAQIKKDISYIRKFFGLS